MRLRHFLALLMVVLLIQVSYEDRLVFKRVDLPYVTDAVGNTLPLPEKLPAKVGSPSNLLTPEKYEFYTFDESGELVKRLMTLEEIQEIVAAGDGNEGHLVTLTEDNEPVIAFNLTEASNKNVHNVVTSVQNVLKAQMEAHKKQPPIPPSTFDTPDVSDSWSMILPSIFGNTGVEIIPDRPPTSFGTPETETIEVTKPDFFINNEGDIFLSKEEAAQVHNIAGSTTTETPNKKTPQSILNTTTENNIHKTKQTTKATRKPTTATSKLSSPPTKPTLLNLPSKVTTISTTSTTHSSKVTAPNFSIVSTNSSPTLTVTSNLKERVTISTTKSPVASTKKFTTQEPAKSSVFSSSYSKKPVILKPSTVTNSVVINTTLQTQSYFSPATVTNHFYSKIPSTEPTESEKPTFIISKVSPTTDSTFFLPIGAQSTTQIPILIQKNSTPAADSLKLHASVTMASSTSIPKKQQTKLPQKPTYYTTTTIIAMNASEKNPALNTTMQNDAPMFDMSQSMSQIVSDLGNAPSYDKIQKNKTVATYSTTPSLGPAISIKHKSTTPSTTRITYPMTKHSIYKGTTFTKTPSSAATDNPMKLKSTTNNYGSIKTSAINPVKSITPSTIKIGSTHLLTTSTEPQPPLIDLNSILDLSSSMSDLLSQVVDNRPSGLILNTSDTTMENFLERHEDMDIMTTTSPTTKKSNKNTTKIVSFPSKETEKSKFSFQKGQLPEKDLFSNLAKITTLMPPMLHDIRNTIKKPTESSTIKTASKTTTVLSLNKEETKITQPSVIVEITSKHPFTENNFLPTSQTKVKVVSAFSTAPENYPSTLNTQKKTPEVEQTTNASILNTTIKHVSLKPTVKSTPSQRTTFLPSSTLTLAKKQDNSKKQTNEKSTESKFVTVNKHVRNITSEKNSVNFLRNSTFKSPDKIVTKESDGLLSFQQSDAPFFTDAKVNKSNNAITSNTFASQEYKIDDTKKKNQKVNIDAKEHLENLNVSWKLVSTVSPPRTLTLFNETKTGDKTNALYSDPGKVINLDSSKENQGLESTTKYLNQDLHLFSELCNELAFKYWDSIIQVIDKKRSFVLSPYAITSMLAMLFMGARGATSGEMNDILKLDEMVTFNPHFVLKNISDSIDNEPSSGVYASAFVRELFSDRNSGKILSFYKERAHQFYGGHVEEVNFRLISDVVRRRTNLLVKRHSWGRISEYIKNNNIFVNPPLAAFSVNIFQTDCSGSVTDGRDGEMYFVVSPSVRHRRLVPVPAVVYKNKFLAGYDPVLDATAASIGDGGSIVSIVFVMPGQQGNAVHSDDLDDLEKRLLGSSPTSPSWNRLVRTLLPRMGLELQVPRFSHTSILNITTVLQQLGMNYIFDSNKADLGGISGPSNVLYVSDMMQSNLFATCGDEVLGEQQQSEIYPGEPLRRRKTFKLNEGISEPRDYQRAFHDPNDLGPAALLPLHLRPRQARVPARSSASLVARLKFDRPFLYFVRHNPTGMILFIGRYNPRLLP